MACNIDLVHDVSFLSEVKDHTDRCSVIMPQKRRTQSWTDLKQAGNECFRAGQYGEAVTLYSQSIQQLEKSGKRSQM